MEGKRERRRNFRVKIKEEGLEYKGCPNRKYAAMAEYRGSVQHARQAGGGAIALYKHFTLNRSEFHICIIMTAEAGMVSVYANLTENAYTWESLLSKCNKYAVNKIIAEVI